MSLVSKLISVEYVARNCSALVNISKQFAKVVVRIYTPTSSLREKTGNKFKLPKDKGE